MLIKLTYHMVLLLYAFPTKKGVRKVLSLHCEIVFCQKLDFAKLCQSFFGLYCEVEGKPTRTNMMLTWATLAIVLGPMVNLQGTYKFYSLVTGKKIKRHMFTPYLMPDLVIKKLKHSAQENKTASILLITTVSFFEWNNNVDALKGKGLLIKDVFLYPSITTEFPGVALTLQITPIKEEFEHHDCVKDAAARNTNFGPVSISGVDAHTISANPDKINDIGINDDNSIIHVGGIHPNQHPVQNPIVMPDLSDDNHNDNNDVKIDYDDSSSDNKNNNNDNSKDDNATQACIVHLDDELSQENNKTEDQGVHRSRHKNRGVTDKYADYTLLMAASCKEHGSEHCAIIRDGVCFFLDNNLSNTKPIPEEERYEYALGVALVTYLIRAGIKKFQEQGEAGVSKELTQMHNMSVVHPVRQALLSKEEQKKALALLMFLKEKRDTTVKARMCADEQGHCGDCSKQDTTSPTVLTELVFITTVVDAHKGCNVVCLDIPGAFLHADLDYNDTGGETCQADGAGCTQLVQKVHHSQQMWHNHPVCQDA